MHGTERQRRTPALLLFWIMGEESFRLNLLKKKRKKESIQ
jgi:hypothetical protein